MLLIYVIFAFILGILAFVLKSMLSQFLLSPVIKTGRCVPYDTHRPVFMMKAL